MNKSWEEERYSPAIAEPTSSRRPVRFLFHCATNQDWAARSDGHYEPAGYADEGFVHLSAAEQMVGTLNKHYPGRDDLTVLTIDPARLSTPPVWEDLYGTGIEFPHVYGPLNLDAVVAVTLAACDERGRWDHWVPVEP